MPLFTMDKEKTGICKRSQSSSGNAAIRMSDEFLFISGS